MNSEKETILQIEQFLESDEKSALITGSRYYNKHLLVMTLLDSYYAGAHVLFRINALQNITDYPFLGDFGVKKQPRAGQVIKIYQNYYEFDSLFNRGTWHKTSRTFDFAICYPVDALTYKQNTGPIDDLYRCKQIDKIFLCSCQDSNKYNYHFLQPYYNNHIIYD